MRSNFPIPADQTNVAISGPSSTGIAHWRRLGKFYTKRTVARRCKAALYDIIEQSIPTLEPSVGAGSFIERGDRIVAFDLAPEHPGAMQIDSLSPHLFDVMRGAGLNEFLAIGNPPFGKRNSLAIAFVNQFLMIGGVVAFVLPVSFRKWSVQQHIAEGARLILDIDVPEDGFVLPDGRDYKIRTCFQCWSIREADKRRPDLRIHTKPPTCHPDFDMRVHTATSNALGDSSFRWDFAVIAHGFGDYGLQLTPADRLSPRKQWMLFSANSPAALKRLKAVDFYRLSLGKQMIPGFGKADVVRAYNELP